ncbi:helix-turn-helix domain-containing protein [Limosilactobacillus reuteri]|uniref:helix-turn-helix domain-containing protein n=1 Tax=Limosilactobacillus reuteri TaxID=1598 RepID=UPI001E3A697E|nr:helix-turn-helix transcriptional regulator [Limosilactobacillus reuteri]MCC4467310.1 helix-turn-helix domain-containing protein [Limosilactobacillus reuteri]MCC4473999.1 helix-turn-helix domain-containing protein [Limosilactobacillus reuteri]
MSTGSKIHDLRKEKRVSQTELAKMVHVSQATVTAWETGKAEPSSSALNALANYFNVSTDYLLGRKELSKADRVHSMSVDEALGTIMSFEGKPVTDHDKKTMKDLLESYLRNRGE